MTDRLVHLRNNPQDQPGDQLRSVVLSPLLPAL